MSPSPKHAPRAPGLRRRFRLLALALVLLPASAAGAVAQGQPHSLETLRAQIDRIDGQLLKLLEERTAVTGEVGAAKGTSGGAVFRPGRQAWLLRNLIARSDGRPTASAIAGIWTAIIAASIRQQKPDFTVAVPQSAGTRAYGAAKDFFGAEIPVTLLPDEAGALAALAAGRADVAALPPGGGWWGTLPDGVRIVASAPLLRASALPELLLLARQPVDPSGADMVVVRLAEGETEGQVLARDGGEMLVAFAPGLAVPARAELLGLIAVPLPAQSWAPATRY